MRILITNDDGINAEGLEVLKTIALGLSSDVWTIAPETNQSGTSHSMTLHTPLRLRTLADRIYAVAGTPTDCVIMAVRHLLKDHPPDLILSGVNHGSNLAEDITYSGTVAAAMEGTLLGVRSVALSQMLRVEDGARHANWETSLAYAPKLLRGLLEAPHRPGTLINVNFPDLAPHDVQGIAVTTQGVRDQALLHIDSRTDPWGTPYFWFGFERGKSTLRPGTDIAAIAEGKISVTPLTVDFTDREEADALAKSLQWSTLQRGE
jgi:5'-nucleotidase